MSKKNGKLKCKRKILEISDEYFESLKFLGTKNGYLVFDCKNCDEIEVKYKKTIL